MKKLLIVTELFHPSIGGQEIRYLELGGVFADNGWKVEIFTIRTTESLPAFDQIGKLEVHRFAFHKDYKRPNSRMRRSPRAIFDFAFQVRKRLREGQFDVVIFNQWPLVPQVVARSSRRAVTLHDWCEHRGGLFWKGVNSLLAASTPKHICVSEGLKATLTAKYGIRDIACIPSGIFTRNYRSSSQKSGVLFLGRLSPHKHPEQAIEAMIVARERGLRETLTVAGSGPMLDELRAKYKDHDYIRIVGSVSDEEKIRLLADHKLLVLPSEREGFPRTVAEAMASGTPTLTTNYPDNGTTTVVNQYECGLVVEPGPNSIAGGMISMLNDDGKLSGYASHGLRNAQLLDWQNIYSNLNRFLEVSQ